MQSSKYRRRLSRPSLALKYWNLQPRTTSGIEPDTAWLSILPRLME